MASNPSTLALLSALMLAACTGARRGAPLVSRASSVEGTTGDASEACRSASVAVQVLGSAGPLGAGGRASSAYLLWVDGRARALLDAGSGLLPRFIASRARLNDLDVVALSHLHVDHSGGLPGLLKAGYFADRTRPLVVLGPPGNADFPATGAFLQGLVGPQSGLYRYLGGYLDGEEGSLFELEPRTVRANGTAFENERLRVEAAAVHHGRVPALGFVVQAGSVRVAFTGDQSAQGRKAFEQLAEDADLLIAHHAIPEDATHLRHLHSLPSELGELAAQTNAGALVLSHNMQRALDDLERGKRAIRASYAGPLHVARDLECFVLR